MKLDYIKDLYEKGLFAVYDEFSDWQSAVLAAMKPLEEHNYIDHEYALKAIEHVHVYGPYIFLAPHICMPHCAAYEYVKKPGVAFMKCNKPVYHEDLGEDMGAELFFAICATKEGEHLQEISQVADILEDEQLVNQLLKAATEEDFKKIL